MKPIRVRTQDGKESLTVGRLVDEVFLIDREDTVLDPRVPERGAQINLPVQILDIFGRNIQDIYYPAFGCDQIGRFIILNDLAVAANRICRILEEWPGGKVEKKTLEAAVHGYQMSVVNTIAGKGGLVSSSVVSARTSESGRAVLLINGTRNPQFAGIPDAMIARLGLKEGDPIVVGRDPSIWHGSMEVVRVARSGNDCIELHPILFAQMGADCDGDQVYVYKIPETAECFVEGTEQILTFAQEHAKWPGWLSKGGKQGEAVAWDRVEEETAERSKITGFSVSPREILEMGERPRRVCESIGKAGAEKECAVIARGIGRKEVTQYLLEQNTTQLRMKVWLGPIGAASNRLKILAGDNRTLLESAMYVSERLQQMLLSSKHVVGGEKKEAYSVEDALALLNRRGKYASADLKTVLKEVESMGLDATRAKPIVTYLWVGYPVFKAAEHFLKSQAGTPMKTRMGAIWKLVMEINTGPVEEIHTKVLKIVQVLKQSKVNTDFSEFRREFSQNLGGLGQFCNRDFPIFDLCSSARTESERALLTQRVILNGEKDPAGITRITMELAEKLADEISND
jgi:hypothetical protein